MESELKDQRVPVMMSASEVKALDAWRREQENLPSRGEAIRRLIELGLKAKPLTVTAEALAEFWNRNGKSDRGMMISSFLKEMKDYKPFKSFGDP